MAIKTMTSLMRLMKLIERERGKWEVFEHFPFVPSKAYTFAFDTETLTYLDGKVVPEQDLRAALGEAGLNEIKERVQVEVWAWQSYDEVNGFYMTNDFYLFLEHLCHCGYKFGWCYNSTFDFSNIDYQILADGRQEWKPVEKGTGKTYMKNQPWTFESIHSDMGARYAYKLWIPYRNVKTRHKMVHAVEFRDFMKFLAGGLASVLDDLDVRDNDNKPIRKLKMDYQNVKPLINQLTDDEIAYCRNDVAGLYFAVKQFNETIERRSEGESHIFGKQTNLMTAGGFAKRQLLRTMYPEKKDYRKRLKKFQYIHPMSEKQDKYLRSHGLYRGGITFVNPLYKGVMNKKPLYRYDVNSEYPYAMSEIRDLIGEGKRITMDEWDAMPNKDDYECAYMLKSVQGTIKPNMLGVWYDFKQKDFVQYVNEDFLHIIWEREFMEMNEWYDLEFECDSVLIWKRGGKAYAPFVLQNYKNKSEATNDSEKKEAKLELNSSYGKLSERCERERGHYEKDGTNGCIHFVRDGVDVDTSSMMSIAVGSLITSFARCYILGKIREICPNPSRDFVYIDTDSIHCFNKYDGCDPKRLGALKLEAVCPYSKYIAPKTYIDIEELIKMDLPKEQIGFEVHSKGINTRRIVLDIYQEAQLTDGIPTLDNLERHMNYGEKYPVLQAVNVKGGKALIPSFKYIAKPLKASEQMYISNLAGTIIQEV